MPGKLPQMWDSSRTGRNASRKIVAEALIKVAAMTPLTMAHSLFGLVADLMALVPVLALHDRGGDRVPARAVAWLPVVALLALAASSIFVGITDPESFAAPLGDM